MPYWEMFPQNVEILKLLLKNGKQLDFDSEMVNESLIVWFIYFDTNSVSQNEKLREWKKLDFTIQKSIRQIQKFFSIWIHFIPNSKCMALILLDMEWSTFKHANHRRGTKMTIYFFIGHKKKRSLWHKSEALMFIRLNLFDSYGTVSFSDTIIPIPTF